MKDKQLNLWALMAAVVGTMIGGGAFNLPKDMAAAANSGAVIIAWVITGLGMIALALVFQNLSNRKSELSGGIYSYAKAGFGSFIGFNSAWGYWIATVLGNVAFVTLLFGSLSYFFPVFENGNNLPSVLGGSMLVWGVHCLILRGVRSASFINIITTVTKLIPIFLFIVITIFAFHQRTFFMDFWGESSVFSWNTVLEQVRETMLVTLWAFVGVEGAIVLSGRAKRYQDVGKATVIGLIGTLAVYMLISILSLGIMPREELEKLPEPSMAYVLQSIVGDWGAVVINLGLVVSLLGAMLSWTLLAVEIPYVAAKDGMFPRSFARQNKNNSPVVSLWWTSLLTQTFILIVLFAASTYQMVYSMASVAVLIPYLLSSLYQLKLLRTGETYEQAGAGKGMDWIIGLLAFIYAVWLLYAAGVEYLLMVSVLYLAGLLMYIWVQRENQRKWFTGIEWLLAAGIILMGIQAVRLISTGQLAP
ncbi:arginine-ornithine antiporter [Lihuaxuella thermophila]|uniref:Arginine-ornithine antiporter n=1 Tax=Lihuaxuella thermophila TaxID=1173111 RepID=A0A1H8ABG7_9BACL|nr:arginine-ornithine antiporter [Lihuaxuella thermophila]SEM67274.1 arginine:ornithine antiporter / lysine permease [Lihuaxuella thermophila]